jgi:Na+/melibiose symporter-like transporter
MADPVISAILFVIGLIISTVIIYITTKLFGQKEGIGRAFATAIIGTVIYSIMYFIFGNGFIAAVVDSAQGALRHRVARGARHSGDSVDSSHNSRIAASNGSWAIVGFLIWRRSIANNARYAPKIKVAI